MSSWAKFGEDESEVETDMDIKKVEKKTKKKEKAKKKERTLSISSISSFEALKNTLGTVRRNAGHTDTMRSVSSQSTAVSSTSSDGTIRNLRRTPTLSGSSESRRSDSDAKCLQKRSGSSTVRTDKSPTTRGQAGTRGMKGLRSRRPTLASLFSRSDTSSTSDSGLEGDSGIATEDEPETSVTLAEISVSETAESEETPRKKTRRPRPVSEQLLTKPRPTGVLGDEVTGMRLPLPSHECC